MLVKFSQDYTDYQSDRRTVQEWMKKFKESPDYSELYNAARTDARIAAGIVSKSIPATTYNEYPLVKYYNVLEACIRARGLDKQINRQSAALARRYTRTFRLAFDTAYYAKPGGTVLRAEFMRDYCKNGLTAYKPDNSQCQCKKCLSYKQAQVILGGVTLGWLYPNQDGTQFECHIALPDLDTLGDEDNNCNHNVAGHKLPGPTRTLLPHYISTMPSFTQAWQDLVGALFAHYDITEEHISRSVNASKSSGPVRSGGTHTNQPDLSRLTAPANSAYNPQECHYCRTQKGIINNIVIAWHRQEPGFNPHPGQPVTTYQPEGAVCGECGKSKSPRHRHAPDNLETRKPGKDGDHDKIVWLCEDHAKWRTRIGAGYGLQFVIARPHWYTVLTRPELFVAEQVRVARGGE